MACPCCDRYWDYDEDEDFERAPSTEYTSEEMAAWDKAFFAEFMKVLPNG